MAGAVLFLYGDSIVFSPMLAIGALALMLVGLPFHCGAVVLPFCVPYLAVYLGLCALPGHTLLRCDLSYGVYLIHSPIGVAIAFLLPDLHPWWLVALVVACITLIVAYLSWTFVENPALQRKKVVSDRMNALFDRLAQMTRSRMAMRE